MKETIIDIAKKTSLKDFISKYNCFFLFRISENNEFINKMDRTIISKIEDLNISKEISEIFTIEKSSRNRFKGLILIGRDINQDIIINSSKISKSHAYFKMNKDKNILKDVGSSNGTFVNEIKLPPLEDYEIKVNDVISFADISFRFMDNISTYYTLRLL